MTDRLSVALVTCRDLPDLDADDRRVLVPLAEVGVTPTVAVWDDPDVDWDAFDLVVVRSTWDYVPRREQFLAWAASVPRLANPADVIAWNTDKRYLRELAAAGVATVPTTWLEPRAPGSPDRVVLPPDGVVVVKPAVSAGSIDTERHDLDAPDGRRLAVEHAERLLDQGRVVMVQPYLAAVDTNGERALLFTGGAYSHSIRKAAILTGADAQHGGASEGDELFKPERITARKATAEDVEVAARVLAAVPGGAARLLYARVDLIDDAEGHPKVLEVELAEPSLFLEHAEGTAERFARAIREHADAARAAR